MSAEELRELLEKKYREYAREEFIANDPVCIPHMFEQKENMEIAGFLSAIISWGQRGTIVKNAKRLLQLMHFDPYRFVMGIENEDLQPLSGFCHRTFNATDLVFFLRSISNIYRNHGGLEAVFMHGYKQNQSIKEALSYFRKVFFELHHEKRTEKHVANVETGSSAKRLNMYLRWMVRSDESGIDLGIWKGISSSNLFLPLDIHTGNVARALGLLNRKQNDWKAVEEVTSSLRTFDPVDPVKYDFALFGMGVFEGFKSSNLDH